MKHELAFQPLQDTDTELPVGGNYDFRVRGEYHLFNPPTVSKLQHAVRQNSFETFQEYTDLIDAQSSQLCTLRGLFEFKEVARPFRSKKSSPPAKSSSASPPAPCRSAPFRRKRTKRWPSP